ncbi:MAG: RDD family protein [Deltaproteobacteria bacterium]|nr:RDD family protein [Deltaproteobacteria bacterium]
MAWPFCSTRPISYIFTAPRARHRGWVGYIISKLPFFLGFIWVAFDGRKQGWHDKIAGTYVIKTRVYQEIKDPPPSDTLFAPTPDNHPDRNIPCKNGCECSAPEETRLNGKKT